MKKIIKFIYYYLRDKYLRSLLWLNKNSKVKNIVIGSGHTYLPGWISTEVSFLDITRQENWARYFNPGTVDRVLSEHVFEHIDLLALQDGLKNIYQYLKVGGRIRIAVPDGFNPSPEYIEHVKIGGVGPGADDHKNLFNYVTLSSLLQNAGFDVELLEYHDESGQFIKNDWIVNDGFISRSLQYGTPNKSFDSSHLSLIIDGVKGAPYQNKPSGNGASATASTI